VAVGAGGGPAQVLAKSRKFNLRQASRAGGEQGRKREDLKAAARRKSLQVAVKERPGNTCWAFHLAFRRQKSFPFHCRPWRGRARTSEDGCARRRDQILDEVKVSLPLFTLRSRLKLVSEGGEQEQEEELLFAIHPSTRERTTTMEARMKARLPFAGSNEVPRVSNSRSGAARSPFLPSLSFPPTTSFRRHS